jgi:virulence-associated protein VapD
MPFTAERRSDSASISKGIGHNSRRGRSMYAITFDFDTNSLQAAYPNTSWNNAYNDVRNFLTRKGFEWKQGSVYFGDESIDAVRCVRVVMQLARKYPWFRTCVRDLRMLRIEENNDLLEALEDLDEE